jgi:hypothetical protein
MQRDDTSVWLIAPSTDRWLARPKFGEVTLERPALRDVCPTCGRGDRHLGGHAHDGFWETGQPRRLGDFLWPFHGGSGQVVVSPRVATSLGLQTDRLEVAENVRSSQTGKEAGALSPTLIKRLAEYGVLRLSDRWHLNVDGSSVEFAAGEGPCPTCGRVEIRWRPPQPGGLGDAGWLAGCEWLEVGNEIGPLGDFVWTRHAADSTAGPSGVFDRGPSVGRVARCAQHPSSLLCDSFARATLVELGASNVDFYWVGDFAAEATED